MEKTKSNSSWQTVLIGLKLLLICAIIAGLVSFVYAVTNDTYAENIKETKENAVGRIFGRDGRLPYRELRKTDAATVSAVFDGETLLGYCVEVKSAGFGGDIELMVGYLADGSILGVDIVSHSETPGLGSKSAEPSYLEKYVGKTGELVANEDIDMIAGASVTSKAVLAGVNQATAALAEAMSEGGVA